MKISVLTENSVCSAESGRLKPEHGLSLFIETGEQKILFDMGQSNLFIRNAKKMGIDLSKVEYVMISHGHFDHGGGLKHFLKINKRAKVILHRHATNQFYTRLLGFIPYYVGLDKKIITGNPDRIIFIEKDSQFGDNQMILEGFPEFFPKPEANKSLFEKSGKRLIPDKFSHELALAIVEKDELVIFSGCSHSGVINIIEKVKQYFPDKKIKAVFGGFHVHNPISKKNENSTYIRKLTAALAETDTVFYTGHCTGESNFISMKEKLRNNLLSMNTGEVIFI